MKFMISRNRRHFLQVCSTASIAAVAATTVAVDHFQRVNPRIKGVSLSAYSLRRHMQWWKGDRTDEHLDILGFLEYCARLGLDRCGADLVLLSFATGGHVHQSGETPRHLLGIDITGGAMGNTFVHPPQSDLGQKEMKYFQSWIDHFADLGAPVVRIFAGRGKLQAGTEDQVMANVIANLEQAVTYAEKHGVMLGT